LKPASLTAVGQSVRRSAVTVRRSQRANAPRPARGTQPSLNARVSSPAARITACSSPALTAAAKKSSKNLDRTAT
jgi:hypothetical protein